MTENKKNEKEKATCVYVPPLIEVHTAEACLILAGTTIFNGSHEDGQEDGNGGHAGDGEVVEIVTGAKILGREFRFSDIWEE